MDRMDRDRMTDNQRLTRYWMLIAGVVLVVAGLLGFVAGNPIASSDPNALFRVNTLHNVIHIATGLLALYIGYAARGRMLADWTIGFGVLYAVVTLLLLVDPTLFGLFSDAPASIADQVLHAVLAIVSIALGYMARSEQPAVAR